MIDVTRQVDAVQRHTGTRDVDAGEARTVLVGQSYETTPSDLWEACTSPERLSEWFVPVTGDLQLNGRFQLEGNAAGTIQECDPPNGFAATWEFGGAVSWIQVRCTPEDSDRARLEIEHIALPDEHWDQFGPGAAGVGWDLAAMGLALYLKSGRPPDPEAVEAWMASAAGKRFIQLSGERWNEADVAAGTDPDTAQGRADRTVSFYTGG